MSTIVVERFVQKFGRLPTEYDPDYWEMLRMSKYRILDVPDMKPGKCANCGSSKNDGRKYIDFGLDVDWYGIVYICGMCLNDIARAMGLFVEVEKKLKTVTSGLEEISSLEGRGKELEEKVLSTFEEVREYFDYLHSLRNDNVPNSNPSLDSSEESSKPGTDSTKQGTTKSSSSGGSEGLLSLAELLDTST